MHTLTATIRRCGQLLAAFLLLSLTLLNASAAPSPFTPSAGSGQGQQITTVTVEELDSVATSNYPLTLSQVFKAGDCHDTVTVMLGDRYLPTQTDVKVRHTDGSVRHALISVVLPRLEARQSLTLKLVDGGNSNADQWVSKEQLLGAGVTARTTFSGARNFSVSMLDMLNQPGFTARYWLKGTIASEFLLNDLALTPPEQQLNVKYNVRVYPGWNGMRVFMVVENVWGDHRGRVDYTVTAPELKLSASVAHIANTRWGREFWVGKQPSRINIRYDRRYLQDSGLLPNYDLALAVPEATLAATHTRWLASDRGYMGNGLLEKYFPATGGREEIGLYPTWAARWLLSQDARLREMTTGHGLLSGAIPIHLRESNAAKAQRFGGRGRVITIDDRPTFVASDLGYEWTQAADKLPAPVGDESSSWSVDRAHQGSLAYIPYLMTGEHYYLEELYFWAAWNLSSGNYNADWGRNYAQGLIRDQVRGEAWAMRTLADAAVIAPDGDPEKSYFRDKVNNNISAWTQKYISGNFHPLHLWGYTSNRPADGGRDDSGLSPLVRHYASSWMDDFMLMTLGHMREQGFATGPLVDWLGRSTVDRFSHADYNPYLGAAYHTPATYAGSATALEPWSAYTSWAAVKAAYVDPAPTRFANRSCAYCYPFNARAALSYVTHLSGGSQAWSFFSTVRDADNQPVLDYAGLNADPTFALVPRSGLPADTTPPVVNLTAPTLGAQISGTATLSANASDNVAVAGVQFRVDGSNRGIEDTTAPYVYSLDTTTLANGSHTVSAIARDAAGLTSSSATVSVTVSNAGDTTPPQLSRGAPSGALAAGTRQTTLSLQTNEAATCRYSTTANAAYATMSFTLIASAGNTHTAALSGLADGGSYRYYLRCRDTAGNANASDYTVSFTVAQPGVSIIDTLAAGHWLAIPNTRLDSVQPSPLPPNQSGFNGLFAWSGGAYDTKRDRLLIWGGGHGDYSGNELYAFDVNSLHWSRLTDPSIDVGGVEASGYYPDGKPRARHSYQSLQYVASIDRFCAFGASAYYPSGQIGTARTDCFNFGSQAWEKKADATSHGYARSAYDPYTGHIWVLGSVNAYALSEFDPQKNSWMLRTAPDEDLRYAYSQGMAIDPLGRRLVVVGNGHSYVWDISNPAAVTRTVLTTSGDKTLETANHPGLVYHGPSDRFVGYAGGADLYELQITGSSGVWTRRSPLAGNTVTPTAAHTTGTHGRFRYIPSKNVFIVLNGVAENVYIYRPTSSDISAPQVSITAPTDGSTVSGMVTASADAKDNVGVVGVQFRVDGKNAGPEDLTPPFSLRHSSTALANGVHTLNAVARDAAGNRKTSTTLHITVGN